LNLGGSVASLACRSGIRDAGLSMAVSVPRLAAFEGGWSANAELVRAAA
jgi:hypothetical protein